MPSIGIGIGCRMALLATAAAGLLAACDPPTGGLGPRVATGGPQVVFDLDARPLPRIPFPNDAATLTDPDSPTGLRVNVSLLAPTGMERHVRTMADRLDGFSTFGMISVEFTDPLDLASIRARHHDSRSLDDDAIYLIDLETGEPVALDLGQGSYPVTLEEQDKFFNGKPKDLRPWDARRDASNFLFETYAEDQNGNGLLDPGEDTDDDGVLDRPNLWPEADPSDPLAAYDGLLTFWERESNTLIVRPLMPLKPRHPYAVVLTGRLAGEDGAPVESPFERVHHLQQAGILAPLAAFLERPPYRLHFGRRSDSDRDFVAFAWAFTTQSTWHELKAVRDGLNGEGPLARLSADFPAEIVWDRLHGDTTRDGRWPWKRDMYRFDGETVSSFLDAAGAALFGNMPEWRRDRVEADFRHIDSIVAGVVRTADLLCMYQDPDEVAPYAGLMEGLIGQQPEEISWEERWEGAFEQFQSDRAAERVCRDNLQPVYQAPLVDLWDEVWQVDPARGTVRACPAEIPFLLAIPKETAGHRQPFPIAFYGHGYTLTKMESLGYMGFFAKHGIASVGWDMPGHGVPLWPGDRSLFMTLFDTKKFVAAPAVDALARNRARSLLRNGFVDDSGGDYWTADTFHTRDIVRQSVVDQIQMIRAFRQYDGLRTDWNVTDHPGKPAGDFDGNGVPDIGGPENDYYVWGQSLGGMIAMISPAVEPHITAAAPVSGGGGLADIAYRSVQGGVREGAQLKMVGPVVVAMPDDPEGNPLPAGQVYLAWYVGNWYYDDLLPIGPVDAWPGDRLVVSNLASGTTGTGVISPERRVLIPLQTDTEDPIAVSVADPASGASLPGGRDTFERDVLYQGRYFCAGSPLKAPTWGWGYRRNTPELRRFMAIAQMVLDPADPINYARHVFQEPLHTRPDGAPARRNLLVVNTIGDMNVPINTGIAYARAAGVLDWDGGRPACPGIGGPDSVGRYGVSGNEFLVRHHVLEGIERLRRYEVNDPDGFFTPDGQPGPVWSLYDPDDLDQGRDGYGAPSPAEPLRWTRDTLTIEEYGQWVASGCSDGPARFGQSGMRLPFIQPIGTHTFEFGMGRDNSRFDMRYYMGNVVGLFFATGLIKDELCMEETDACGSVEPVDE